MKNGETKTSGQPVRRRTRRTRESPAARAGRPAGLIRSLGDSRTPKYLASAGPRPNRIRRVLQRLLRGLLAECELLQLCRHEAVHLLVVARVDVGDGDLLGELLEEQTLLLPAVVVVRLAHVGAAPRRLE